MMESVPLQSGGSGFLWIILGLILAFWVYKIETGGSSSDEPRPRRSPSRSQKRSAPTSELDSEPEPKPKTEDDDIDVGVDREPYAERLERPKFDFDESESRMPTDSSDNQTSSEDLPDLDELPDPDDLLKDQ